MAYFGLLLSWEQCHSWRQWDAGRGRESPGFMQVTQAEVQENSDIDRRRSYSGLSPSLCRPWESMLCLILLLGIWDRVSLYNPGWSGICYVAPASHKLPILLLSLLRPRDTGIYQFYCFIVFVCFLKIESHVAQASFELLITLSLPPENVGITGVYLHIQYYYWFSLFRFIYFTFSIVFAYVDDCALHVRILPTGTGRRCQTPWNYKQFWVTMWVLGIKSGSSKRVASALNYCIISLVPLLLFL